jgi:hypothetical protein
MIGAANRVAKVDVVSCRWCDQQLLVALRHRQPAGCDPFAACRVLKKRTIADFAERRRAQILEAQRDIAVESPTRTICRQRFTTVQVSPTQRGLSCPAPTANPLDQLAQLLLNSKHPDQSALCGPTEVALEAEPRTGCRRGNVKSLFGQTRFDRRWVSELPRCPSVQLTKMASRSRAAYSASLEGVVIGIHSTVVCSMW